MSSSNFSADKYCCLPGCTSSSYTPNVSLFVVPSGKKNRRYGDAANMQTWSEDFLKILFKYRAPSDKNFGKRCKNGTAYICSVHFEDVHIQRTSKMSWLKYGVLPSKSMPQKSISTKSPVKRKSIVKHELPVKAKRVCQYKTLDEIRSHFWSLKTISSRWELQYVPAENIASSSTEIPSKSFLRLSFWNPVNYRIRAVPHYTVLIYSSFEFQIYIDSFVLPSDHDLYNLSLIGSNAATVKDVLLATENYKLCDGYYATAGQRSSIPILKESSATTSLSTLHLR